MIDLKVRQKKRLKFQKLVEQRVLESNGEKSEKEVKKELMKEQRTKMKDKKKAAEEEIRQQVMKDMAGKDAKVVDKAVKRAIARSHSRNRKSKQPGAVLKEKAAALVVTVNTELWCPRDQGWWDHQCQDTWDDLAFLAGCWDINLAKSPQNFADIYPEECKQYFDMLAKKRFNTPTPAAEAAPGKKAKNALEKKFEERKADSKNNNKSDKVLMEEVVTEMVKENRAAQVKELRKQWRPTHKPFFDKLCHEAFNKIAEAATKQGFDLDNNVADFKKFKRNNKKMCTDYFKLLDERREAFNLKKKIKEENKALTKLEKEVESKEESVNSGENKKIKFDDDGDVVVKENNVLINSDDNTSNKKALKKLKNKDETLKKENVGGEVDIDATIRKIDRKLKKNKKKSKTVKS